MSEIKQAPDSIPIPKLTEQELANRKIELDEVLKIYDSVPGKLLRVINLTEEIITDINKIEYVQKRSHLLRAAMVVRLLNIKSVRIMVENIRGHSAKLAAGVKLMSMRKRAELEEIIKDPALLR